ncbi:hypothetical protein [Alloscardovia macacae]|uniref:Uncharacterized protein n=1 Tax=Alloscardovia macacae TaxID=1160091 RepID=A0A261F4Y4_9BIFI|nr:hypothetical protein [Alloscardovia macacae]OZG54135.1 hypothetical protein ALMA_0596 [Alloscardovia macacae]
MIMHIDKNELETLMYKHKEVIGTRGKLSLWGEMLSIVANAVGVLTTSIPNVIKLAMGVLIVILGYDCIRQLYAAYTHPYTVDRLSEDIVELDRTERRSSIIAIRDPQAPSRYLVYKDTGWGCDLFPNVATREPAENDVQHIRESLQKNYGLHAHDIKSLTFMGRQENEKPSPEHKGELRYYTYSIYNAQLEHVPAEWQHDTFTIDNRECAWKTLDEMNADEHTHQINADVLSFVKYYQ